MDLARKPFSLEGCSAVITGGGRGIGRATAEIFAKAGADVVVGDVDGSSAENVAKQIESGAGGSKAVAHQVDVSRSASVADLIARAVAEYGRLDVIFHAAGVWQGGTVLQLSEEDWDRVMEVNTKGLFALARHGFAHLAATQGSIISVASVAALKGTRAAGAYNASKAAVVALTKNLALDFAPDRIRVNCICPGLVETKMGDDVIRYRGGESVREKLVDLHPIGRLGRPEDVGYAALYLASREAGWVTGTALVVDGGCMAGY